MTPADDDLVAALRRFFTRLVDERVAGIEAPVTPSPSGPREADIIDLTTAAKMLEISPATLRHRGAWPLYRSFRMPGTKRSCYSRQLIEEYRANPLAYARRYDIEEPPRPRLVK